MGKGKAIQIQDDKANSNPTLALNFTPVHGQASAPPLTATKGPPPNIPLFIPTMLVPRFPTGGMPTMVVTDAGVNKFATERRCDVLEERLRAIEETNAFGSIDPVDLCLVSKVVLPPKFKIPNFEKFDGTWCPRTYLRLYCQAMAAYSDDGRLMVHGFHNSLTGSTIRWYTQQDRTRICYWKGLTNAFMAQYRHLIEMAPDQMTLQAMEKGSTKTFWEYICRWRDIATQVIPLVGDREAISLFMNTLKDPYCGHLLGSTP
ncbi:uncharacterized protein LOC131147160 [Malania oleifera]|uniref:uncharacterized protein LOC131147160 n=1 Tax=Malania oleifera TaxID=397392 RepID=UPI0025ADB135|nr:uncharacterized protein LOC131147160 [Malania oleifera]